jgi:hypothetical protein
VVVAPSAEKGEMLSQKARVQLCGKLASQSSSLSSYLVLTCIFIAVRLLLAEISQLAGRPLWLLRRSAEKEEMLCREARVHLCGKLAN